MKPCPVCGTGELRTFAGDDNYTPGEYGICDCGYSTVLPCITLAQWREKTDSLLSERKSVIQQRIAINAEVDRLSAKISDAMARHGKLGDGRDAHSIAPLSRETGRKLDKALDVLERRENELWNAYTDWCLLFPAYAHESDK